MLLGVQTQSARSNDHVATHFQMTWIQRLEPCNKMCTVLRDNTEVCHKVWQTQKGLKATDWLSSQQTHSPSCPETHDQYNLSCTALRDLSLAEHNVQITFLSNCNHGCQAETQSRWRSLLLHHNGHSPLSVELSGWLVFGVASPLSHRQFDDTLLHDGV